MYFLWKMVNMEKTVVYENVEQKQIWIFEPGGPSQSYSNARVEDVPALKRRETIHLFDAKAGGGEPVKSKANWCCFRPQTSVVTSKLSVLQH